jgi:hypothetical protein
MIITAGTRLGRDESSDLHLAVGRRRSASTELLPEENRTTNTLGSLYQLIKNFK